MRKNISFILQAGEVVKVHLLSILVFLLILNHSLVDFLSVQKVENVVNKMLGVVCLSADSLNLDW